MKVYLDMLLGVISTIFLWNIPYILCSADHDPIQINQQQEICQEIKGEEILAILGFPLDIRYHQSMRGMMYLRSKHLKQGSNITCIVVDAMSSQVKKRDVFPRIESYYSNPMISAYKIPEVTQNTTLHYRIECGYSSNSTVKKVDEPHCIFYNVNITTLNDSASNGCDGPAINTRYYRMPKGENHRLSCFGGTTRHFQYFPNLTFRWFHKKNGDCTSNLEKNVVVDESRDHQLTFKKSDFHNAGVYTCAAIYNDQKFVLVRQNVCVKYRYIPNAHMELKCNTVTVPVDGNGTVTCDVSVSMEKSLWGQYFWYKVHPNGEIHEVCNDSYSIEEGRVSCFDQSSIDTDPCYYSEPTEDSTPDVRTITLNIRKMKAEDFGTYRLQYRVTGIMKERLSTDVTIEMDTKNQVANRIAGISFAVLIAILFIGVIALGISMKLDVLWFYKKHFGAIEQRIYPYMAHFVYQYRKGEHDDESNKKTKALVENMHDFVSKLGGSVFDEQKDAPFEQCDGSNMLAVQGECHRIVLFLSAEFVTDQWSRFATYTAMEGVIREERKIILITMPETECAMKRIDNQPKRVLEMAMKTNTTIHWNGKVPFSGAFRRRLEYAFPKCRRNKPGFNRYHSDSSQAHLTEFGSPAKSLFQTKKSEPHNNFGSMTTV